MHSGANDGTELKSLTERAECTLREAILTGVLKPGSRLTIPALSEQLGFGTTPLREGLSRLVAQELVTVSNNRGFRVARVSYQDLLDISLSRIAVEQAALRLAFARSDETWEDEIVMATHRLLRIIRKGDSAVPVETEEYEAAHKQFHVALIGVRGLRRLMAVQSQLYDAARRYRRVMWDARLSRDYLYDIHQSLSRIVLARSCNEALGAIEEHIMINLKTVYGDLNPRHQ